MLALVIAGATGCLKPPPRAETAGPPPASQPTPAANGVKFAPPQLGAAQRISGADPLFPMGLRASGRTFVVSAKICVSNAGLVDSVSILEGNDPTLTLSVVNAVNAWRYTPLTTNGGIAVPFCYVTRFVFKAT
jgi:hypothetical protein